MDDASLKSTAPAAFPAAAMAALQQGDKIGAIKIVRQERNIGLKDAKDAVDDYVSARPDIQATLAARSANARSALLWRLALLGLAVVAYFLLRKT